MKGFGCHVLDYDVVFRKRRHLDFWLGFAELIFICTPEIKGFLLDEREFKLMKNRPLVVNVSGRVSLVNEKVLHDFISRGWVRGYACDEKSEEHKHCFFQKHQGAKSIEAIERREKELEKNIKTLIDRHKFINNNSPV